MRDMLGNYACPLLVLVVISSLQQTDMVNGVFDFLLRFSINNTN